MLGAIKAAVVPYYVPLIVIVNALINLLTITTNAARVTGVETRRVATSLTLYNLFQTTFRLMTLFYTPFLGAITDAAVKARDVGALETSLRWVIGGATVGAFLGLLLLPSFVELFTRGVSALERYGSMPRLLVAMLKPSRFVRLFSVLRPPRLTGVQSPGSLGYPAAFLWYNVVGVAIWTIGVLSAHLASVYVPDLARTALMLSGVVNGFGTISLFVFVDPVASMMVDQAASGKRPVEHIHSMTFYLALGSIAGTLLAQALLVPGAMWIAWCARVIGE